MRHDPPEVPQHADQPAARASTVNRKAAENAIRDFIHALGIDATEELMHRTPARLVDAYVEFLTPRPFKATSFPNHSSYEDLVYVEDISFRSICEHHLLPFIGRACIGYVPDSRLLGLSKLARGVELFACRPQVQERLTVEIADWIAAQSSASGVGVVIRAEHSCMTLRGARAVGTMMTTRVFRGVLSADGPLRREFLELTRTAEPHGPRGSRHPTGPHGVDQACEDAAWL